MEKYGVVFKEFGVPFVQMLRMHWGRFQLMWINGFALDVLSRAERLWSSVYVAESAN